MAMTAEERHRPGVLRLYEGEGINVGWEPRLCIHLANCIRALPQTFDPQARPWVKIDSATADEIAEAVRLCPTGALRFTRTDDGEQEEPRVPTMIQPRVDGPLFVEGDLEVVDAQGNVRRRPTRIALCRCGQSQNKPYCDLSHRTVGFKS